MYTIQNFLPWYFFYWAEGQGTCSVEKITLEVTVSRSGTVLYYKVEDLLCVDLELGLAIL